MTRNLRELCRAALLGLVGLLPALCYVLAQLRQRRVFHKKRKGQ